MRDLRLLALILGLYGACCAAADAPSPPDDTQRTQTYKEFRSLFDAHQYDRALPLAQQVVIATEQQYGSEDRALVNPLSNVATTQYRLKNYEEARKNYERAISILDDAGASADRQLLRPLQGLGLTEIAQGENVDAALTLKRALDLSRNLDGLFNIEQLQYLSPLIASYVALGRNTDADKEHQYMLRVAENNYGQDDKRILAPIDTYARWLEDQGRYAAARALHERALEIAEKSGGKESILTVVPLEGLARSYRLEYFSGEPEGENTDDSFGPANTGARGLAAQNDRINPQGEHLLKQALAAVDKSQPVDHRQRGAVLIDLGDWYISTGDILKGLDSYRVAWKELAHVDATAILEKPERISYRPPSASLKRSTLDPSTAQHAFVEVGLTVSRAGKTENVRVLESDAPEAIRKSVESAMKKARYRPRFDGGEPVETRDVKYREQLLLKPKK